MKNILLIISCLTFLSVGQVFAGINDSIIIPKGAFPIVYRGHIYIHGFADSIPGDFVFDTGASGFYFDSTFYSHNEFYYPNLADAILPGAGTTPQKVKLVLDTVGFSFGEHYYRSKLVPILKLKPILGDFSDGILGLNYFSESVVEINYTNEYMKVHSSMDSIDAAKYQMISLKRIKNRLYIPLQVNINDSIKIRGDFTLDFGSGGSITLNSAVAKKYDLNKLIKEKVLHYSKYGGVGGASSSYYFRAASFQIADFSFENITMEYSIDTAGALASKTNMGLLGNDILQRFDILIDFRNSNMYIKPNEKYEEAFVFSRLGFSYVDRNETMGAWIVTGLYRDRSPEKKGLRIDDQIISVNGFSVADIPYENQHEFLNNLKQIEIVVLRDGQKLKVKFNQEYILN